MNKNEKNYILKTEKEIIYRYDNVYIKKVKIRDFLNNKLKKINFRNMTIAFKEIENFKISDNYDVSFNDIANWYKYYPVKNKVKNYLKYSDIEFSNIDLPADKSDLKKYKIMGVVLENKKNSTEYFFKEEDMQLAVLLAEQKVTAVWHLHNRKTKYIEIEEEKYTTSEKNFLEIFEIIFKKKASSFTIIFEGDEMDTSHFYIVSYPIFNKNDTLTIIESC